MRHRTPLVDAAAHQAFDNLTPTTRAILAGTQLMKTTRALGTLSQDAHRSMEANQLVYLGTVPPQLTPLGQQVAALAVQEMQQGTTTRRSRGWRSRIWRNRTQAS